MKAVVLLLCVGWALAAASPGLYGLDQSPTLIKIDPDTGACTPVGSVIPNEIETHQLSAIDNKRGVLYLIGYNQNTHGNEIIGVSLDSGNIDVTIPIPFHEPMINVGMSCAFDEARDLLYVMGALNNTWPNVISVNVQTKKINNLISNIPGDLIFVSGVGAAYDAAGHNIYFPIAAKLKNGSFELDFYSIDADTPGKYSHIPNPYVLGPLVGIGLQGTQRILVSLDGTSGKETIIANLQGGYLMVESTEFALDPTNQVGYAIMSGGPNGDPLLSIDMKKGSILKSPAPQCDMWSLQYYRPSP